MFSTRLGILATFALLAFAGIAIQLGRIQLVNADPLRVREDIEKLQSTSSVIPAVRGAILDRDGKVLRASRDAVAVAVIPARFRERSLADAVADLNVLLDPAAMGGSQGATYRRERLDEALRNPVAAAKRVLALPLTAMKEDPAKTAPFFMDRMAALVQPEGSLLRTTADGRTRLVEAASVLIPKARQLRPKAVRARLMTGSTLGDALELTPAALAEDMAAEEATLTRLAVALRFETSWLLRDRVTARCDVQWQTVVALALDERLNDAICQQEFGLRVPKSEVLGTEDYAAIAARAAAPCVTPEVASAAVEFATAILAGSLPSPANEPEAVAPGVDIDDAEDMALEAAKGWKLVDPTPKSVVAAYCAGIRAAPDFARKGRDTYQDARKRQQTVADLRDDRTHRLAMAPDYVLADMIEGTGGLDALGFRIEPEIARDGERAVKGASLSLLLGAVTMGGTPVGRGVETFAQSTLMGKPGSMLVSQRGKSEVVEAVTHGDDVVTSLSLPLQQKIERLLSRPGAIAVVDVNSGGVLAASTFPAPSGEDPVDELEALSHLEERLRAARALARHGDRAAKDEAHALRMQILGSPALHRAVAPAGQTPPGSVFKVLTLLLAMERGVARPDETMDCELGPRSSFGCHHHGVLDLRGAIEKSCNHYCYESGLRLAPTRDAATLTLVDFYHRMGLFDPVPGLIGPGEGQAFERILRRRPDDPRNDAIGQGSLTFAPIRVAGIAASLASGRVVHPWLIRDDARTAIGEAFASEANLNVVREGMRRACESAGGTAGKLYRGKLTPLKIAGKTGTAQLSSGENPLYAAWLVGYAPHDRPRYAFAVMFDRYSGEGADCAPLAATVVNACYDVLGGRP